MEKWELKKEIEKAHNRHAQTLAALAWFSGAAVLYATDAWLSGFKRGGIAELAQYVLYVVAFFYIAVWGWLQDFFYGYLVRDKE
ncbi:hypothetical protein ACOQNP_23990 [Ectopseudomonas khazarica]|uniref:hypothetical protein n=1 Tax=Ectopseudomonas khazarica TaxID=2502979 RepID=UPI003B937CB8